MPIRYNGPSRTFAEYDLAARGAIHESGDELRNVDLFFVCCTDAEEDALVARLFSGSSAGPPRPFPPTMRRFYEARVGYGGMEYDVAACKATGQGAMSMLDALADVHSHFRPRAVCLVGIAGAISDDLGIGDVVVATDVYLYERGKDRGDAIDRELQSFCMNQVHRNLVDAAIGDMRRISSDVSVQLGKYGTGEKVVASELSTIREYLGTVDRKVVAVEMESGGFYKFFDSPSFKQEADLWLVVKGISDHANPAKADSSQPLAARNSVNAALALVTRVLGQLDLARSSDR